MKPNRFEWLGQERERVAREGTGAQYVSYVSTRYLKRSGGMSLAVLLIFFIAAALPLSSDGVPKPLPVLVTGIVLTALSTTILRSLRPAGLMLKSGLWTTVCFGSLMILAGLFGQTGGG